MARLYHPGDIVGLAEIDSGISTAEHSWICALEDCDLFYCSTRYVSMIWD